MSASIWAPGSELVVVDAESTNLSQVFTASAGQTVFTLTEFSYTIGTGSVAVYRGGQKLVLGIDYTETSSSSVTLQGISPAAGETFEVIAIIGSASAFAGQAEAAAVVAVASAAAALHPWEAEAEGIHYDLGNVRIGGVGKRITGDFSNATFANRVMFQTSTVNGGTNVGIIPNGTGTQSGLKLETDSTVTNGSVFSLDVVGGSDARIASNIRGTGSYLPMTFYTGGSERMRIDTSGNVGIGGAPSGSRKFEVISSGTATDFWVGNTNGFGVQTHWDNISGYGLVCTVGGYPLKLGPNSTAVLSIDNNANTLHIHPNGGLGYGTGAGGTVTQATSKSTAVTLNKPTGQITTHSSALAAGATAQFTLNNTVIGVNDGLFVQVLGPNGAAGYNYRIGTVTGSFGSALISVTNMSAGALAEALILQFFVIKGATA